MIGTVPQLRFLLPIDSRFVSSLQLKLMTTEDNGGKAPNPEFKDDALTRAQTTAPGETLSH